jgi:murein DD-endopeptidase MepM/ murein hydrolase activator NlpD
MNKITSTTLLTIFAISYLSPTIGSAIDPATSGRIIDNFKAQQEEILFESSPVEVTDASKILEQEYAMKWLESLKARLALMQSAYQSKKESITETRVTLEQALANLADSIKITEESIARANIGIFEKRQKIQQLRSDWLLLRAKIREHRKVILSYLANIYSEWNVILDESGNVDLIKWMILSSEDTDFSLSDITYKTLVTQMWQKFVNEYRDLVRSYYLLQIRSKDEENQLTQLKSDLEYQNNALLSKKTEREKLLEITQWQEALYVQYIASQQQAQSQVELQWKAASEKYQDGLDTLLKKYNCTNAKKDVIELADCARIRQFFLNEKELANAEIKEGTPNVLDWPVKEKRITAYFHDAEYYQVLRSHHDAIDIATPQGTDISAPADGYVFYVLEPKPGGYSYLAIKHKNGFVTVYGHLSEIKVAKYDFLKKWQVFAKSGWAVGTPGAGPMTSGPHLHFEVWKNKESVDPLRYLSLSDLDYAELPPVYQDKFITDIVEKSGTGADMTKYKKKFNLIGATEIDRQKYLLSTYATPDFQNWKMWIDTALDAKIDPSFMLCIGLAETTLGNHLKTSFNIGNIWNTDSGSTYSFTSPQEGLSWMTATFNNKFLGKYTKLSELSRWWNTDGAIYASSNSNWHNNTVRCLSALKWEFVPDDYAFRLQ